MLLVSFFPTAHPECAVSQSQYTAATHLPRGNLDVLHASAPRDEPLPIASPPGIVDYGIGTCHLIHHGWIDCVVGSGRGVIKARRTFTSSCPTRRSPTVPCSRPARLRSPNLPPGSGTPRRSLLMHLVPDQRRPRSPLTLSATSSDCRGDADCIDCNSSPRRPITFRYSP